MHNIKYVLVQGLTVFTLISNGSLLYASIQRDKRKEEQMSSTTQLKQISISAMFIVLVSTIQPVLAYAEGDGGGVKINGDFRYRHELIDEEGVVERHRQRMRGRVGLSHQITDKIETGVRLTTGGAAITSNNESFDGAFAKKSIDIDTFYAKVKCENSSLTLGKMDIPFFLPGSNTLIWDKDVTPEGISYAYWRKTDSVDMFFNLAGFWLNERAVNSDSALLGGQLGAKFGNDAHKLTAGASYYGFANVKGKGALDAGVTGQGNTLTGGNYANGYNVVEIFAEYWTKVGSMPLLLGASLINNTEADDDNAGYEVNVKVGNNKEAGDWFVQLFLLELEKDSTLAILSESDPFDGGTDGSATGVAFGYTTHKAVHLQATYWVGKQGLTNSTDFNRGQLDAVFKF